MQPDTPALLAELTELALSLGATAAAPIEASAVSAQDDLAAFCLEPRCPNYGLAASCPPFVAGPAALRKMLPAYNHALLIKIEAPARVLQSPKRRDVFRLLHRVVAGVEQRAASLGCPQARAFAGGSCKAIFCAQEPDCPMLAGGQCRHPDVARPSMSGFGVDVQRLMQAAGWPMDWLTHGEEPAPGSTGSLCGLVLLC